MNERTQRFCEYAVVALGVLAVVTFLLIVAFEVAETQEKNPNAGPPAEMLMVAECGGDEYPKEVIYGRRTGATWEYGVARLKAPDDQDVQLDEPRVTVNRDEKTRQWDWSTLKVDGKPVSKEEFDGKYADPCWMTTVAKPGR
jgi:hypothetical protein